MLLPRQHALDLLHQYIKNERMIFHSLASEAVMRALARKLGREMLQPVGQAHLGQLFPGRFDRLGLTHQLQGEGDVF